MQSTKSVRVFCLCNACGASEPGTPLVYPGPPITYTYRRRLFFSLCIRATNVTLAMMWVFKLAPGTSGLCRDTSELPSLQIRVVQTMLCSNLAVLQAFLLWLGFEQTQDGDPDEDSEEAANLQRAISLSAWPTTPGFAGSSTFTSSKTSA